MVHRSAVRAVPALGIYAAAARHEWIKSREQLTDADYQRYFDHFDPDLYDPGRLGTCPTGTTSTRGPRAGPSGAVGDVVAKAGDHEDWEVFSRQRIDEGARLSDYYPLTPQSRQEYEEWRSSQR
ncbi:hypothetical protein [Rugosimonospora africana]|uniref:Uncharacterized protein n=1 Tax=Rugosimonospora africana TaxID=556532 RepID=A0A8J3VUG7_9ACTN|nr:hypothetical protein [Rugosimonospora africana]GIH19512.1 hypothetical protein Raf01_76840 [Rugosimonospora africana]